MNLYEILGVDLKASQAEIKAAYRKAMATCHADKGGTDGERSKALGEAYAVLKEPKRRAHYDATGKTNVVADVEVDSRHIVRAIFTEHFNRYMKRATEANPYVTFRSNIDPEIPNFHLSICDEIRNQLDNLNTAERLNSGILKKLNKILKNIITKSGEPDSLFNPIIAEKIEEGETLIKEIAVNKGLYSAALKLMQEGFKYNAPDPKPSSLYNSIQITKPIFIIGSTV